MIEDCFMHNTDSYDDLIASHVQKLNLTWFEAKTQAFKAYEEYNSNSNSIYILHSTFSPEEQQENEEGALMYSGLIESVTEIEISLRRYCACYLPLDEITYWGAYPYDIENPKPSKNIKEVASSLIRGITEYLVNVHDLVKISEFISQSLARIHERLLTMEVSPSDDITYRAVLNDFLKECSDSLYRKYQKELTVINATEIVKDKVLFNLNLQELASLIFILNKTEIIPRQENPLLLEFCQKYFHFHLAGGYKLPTTLATFMKKYREAANFRTPGSENFGYPAMEDLMSYLHTKLTQLKRG